VQQNVARLRTLCYATATWTLHDRLFVFGTIYISKCLYAFFQAKDPIMADDELVNRGQDQGRSERPRESDEARAFANKFNISLDKAKRLLEQHRAILERETGKPNGRS
jgi:hypothetical protein